MSRPRGLFVSRDTQATAWPSRVRPTAVFSSAPPTIRSSDVACSSRRKLGGLRRIIASPKVITSYGMVVSPRNAMNAIRGLEGLFLGACLLHDAHILAREVANALEI